MKKWELEIRTSTYNNGSYDKKVETIYTEEKPIVFTPRGEHELFFSVFTPDRSIVLRKHTVESIRVTSLT